MNWIIRPYQPDDAAWLLSAEMAIQMHEIAIHDPRLAQSRLPGSETSIRLYGHAEAHGIHDFGRSAPDDIFTNLMFQPVGSEVAANPALGVAVTAVIVLATFTIPALGAVTNVLAFPAMLGLLGMGLIGVGAARRRQRRG